jgi:hypothetical protein
MRDGLHACYVKPKHGVFGAKMILLRNGKKSSFVIDPSSMLEYQKNVLFKNEHFTVLLRAVFYFHEELVNRGDPTNRPPSDRVHLGGNDHSDIAFGEKISA